ncbi:DUF481 domain-containing protein [Emcibacter sp.]|uniref:DUF481 domain-containing protein n=1 Tax=Emcibacter sp. TaxID=1979954 RepID=UPI003A905560
MAILSIAPISVQAETSLPQSIDKILRLAAKRHDQSSFSRVVDIIVDTYPALKSTIWEKASHYRQNWLSRVSRQLSPQPKKKTSPVDIADWNGEINMSLFRSTGNSPQKSVALGAQIEREHGSFISKLISYYELSKSDDDPARQQWGLRYKLNYDVTEKMYLTGTTGYENDTDGAFRERFSLTSGAGLHLFDFENLVWDIEGGPGILWTQREEGLEHESGFIGLLRNEISYNLSDHSSLTNQTEVYLSNNRIISNSAVLKVRINSALSSRFSYDVTYEQDAYQDSESTEKMARAGLLYDF